MKKRILSVLLTAVMLASAAGCAKNSGGSNPSEVDKTGQGGTAEFIKQDDKQAENLTSIHQTQMDTSVELSDANLARLLEKGPDVSVQRDAILNSTTEIKQSASFIPGETYTGTAYYVSNSGSDTNAGTSPEQPWATLERVNSAALQRGDAVFFERGDIWYGRLTVSADEVTISAYGTGDKPILSGSDPDVGNPDRWKEHAKTQDGGTVWVYENAATDVTQIFFNNGEEMGIRVTPNCDADGYVDAQGKNFDVCEGLTEDLSFFCELELSEWNLSQTLADEYHEAKLYLRCDKGNPGEIFSDIQIMYTIYCIGNEFCGTVVDNLSIQYYGSLALSGGMGMSSSICDEYALVPSVTVQNCEVSYCGGGISNYHSDEGTIWQPDFSGGAFQLSGNGNRALNNYIHDVDYKVFVIAHHGQDDQGAGYEDITISGNLLVNNCCALHLTDYSYWIAGKEDPCYFKNVCFSENTVLYTGFGWFRQQQRSGQEYPDNANLACIELCGNKHENDSITIRGNLFYGAELALVFNPCSRENPDMPEAMNLKEPVFSGNTYVQYGYAGRHGDEVYPAALLESYVRDVLKDETGTIGRLPS